MTVEPVRGEIKDSMTSTDSHLRTALNIYLQGLVVAVFGLLFYVVVPWLPLDYKVTGFILAFLAVSYVLGIINSRVTMRFWSQDYRSSKLSVLGQGAVLLFCSMFVLACATTVYTIQIEGGPQIDSFYQIQLAFWTTLISPPFYGFLARDVASWKISPLD